MKLKNINRFWMMLVALAIAMLACQGGGVVQPTTPDQPNVPQDTGTTNDGLSQGERSNLISATVQIYGLFNKNGKMVPGYVGSGTIIAKNGLILTNAHVASPASQGDTQDEPDALAVGLVESEDRAPVFNYLAEVKAVDGFLDMAVIQINSTMDGASVDPNNLNLPFVSLGNSDQVHIGDHVSIFGFPGIGGETITYTDGNVSGFTSEDPIGDRAWIKTDATISGGNSGGLAANDNAQIIGIPTIASSGADTDITDCRVVQDTNGDGQLDNQDTCIPIGGFINGIRPVNLAQPLIRAALQDQAYTSPYSASDVPTESATGQEQMGSITWKLTDSEGNITDAVDSYPSGVNVLVATFDFNGFVDGEAWGDKWYMNGDKVYEGAYKWDQGEQGDYFTYINTTDDSPFPEGTYKVEIYAGNGNTPLTQAEVNVGGGGSGGTPSRPNQSNGVAIYGNVYDSDSNRPISGAYVFVLNPGTTYDEWSNKNFPQSDVYSSTQTDSNGNYRMPDKVKRDTAYTVVASIQGYYDQYGDDLTWTDQDPSEYQLDIGMSK
jgi:serine protease Do